MHVFSDHHIDLHHGDLLHWLPTVQQTIDLIFADPPFNIRQKYEGYSDRKDAAQFRDDLISWCQCCCRSLRPGGVFALHVPDSLARTVIKAEDSFDQMKQRDWIIWHYRFGICRDTRWINAKCHCLIYVKDGARCTWNPDAVRVASDRATTYNDKRISETDNGGSRVPFDVWGIPSDGPFWGRVHGGTKERVKTRPNQLPEVYLARIIKAYTNEGDTVCDPFCGTGTTAVVARALGRRFIGGDVDAGAIAATIDRLERGAVRL